MLYIKTNNLKNIIKLYANNQNHLIIFTFNKQKINKMNINSQHTLYNAISYNVIS